MVSAVSVTEVGGDMLMIELSSNSLSGDPHELSLSSDDDDEVLFERYSVTMQPPVQEGEPNIPDALDGWKAMDDMRRDQELIQKDLFALNSDNKLHNLGLVALVKEIQLLRLTVKSIETRQACTCREVKEMKPQCCTLM